MVRPLPVLGALVLLGPGALRAQSPDQEEAWALKMLEILQNTQVTSASKRQERMLASPQAIEVLKGEDLRRMGVHRLVDALKLLTSVDVLELGTRGTFLALRGLTQEGDARTVQVLIDGLPLYNPELNGIDLDNLPLPVDLIERVELVRGPSSSLYGANAVAGVVAITTRRPQEGFEGSLRVARANLGTSRGAGELRFGAGPFGLVAGLSGVSSGPSDRPTWDLDHGTTVPMDKDASHSRAIFLRPQFQRDGMTLWASFGDAYRKTRVSSLPPSQFAYQAFRASLFQAGWEQAWSGTLSTFLRLERSDHVHSVGAWPRGALFFDDPRLEVNGYPWLDVHSDQVVAQVNWSLSEGLHLVGGADARRIRSGAVKFLGLTAQRESASGAFLNLDWTLTPGWNLALGARAENETLGGSRTSPRAVLAWSPNPNQSLRIGAYSATRSPQIAESRIDFTLDPVPNVEVRILPNPDLRPETLDSLEAGYRQIFGLSGWSLDLTLFRTRLKRLIAQVDLPPAMVGTTRVFSSQFLNQGSALSQGSELALGWTPRRGLSLGANWTWLSFTPENPYTQRTYIPTHKVNLYGRFEYRRLSGYLGLQVASATDLRERNATGSAYDRRPPLRQIHGQVAWHGHGGWTAALYVQNGARSFTNQGEWVGIRNLDPILAARREAGITVGWTF